MFFLKDKNKNKTSIVAIISIAGKYYKYFTGESTLSDFWNPKTHRPKVVNKNPGSIELIRRLNSLEIAINDASDYFRKNEKIPSEAEFREKITTFYAGPKKNNNGFVSYIENFISKRDYKPETLKKYITAIHKLRQFEKEKKRNLLFNDIDISFYNEFREWFYSQTYARAKNSEYVAFSSNYFGSIVKVVKKVMNFAVENSDTETRGHKHSDFKTIQEDSISIYLTIDELLKIHRLKIDPETINLISADQRPQNVARKIESLCRVRDRFLVGAFTALRVSDFNRLENIHFAGNFLKIITRKTGKQVIIPVHPIVAEIVERGGLNYSISEQKINEHIKEICRLAGIDATVTLLKNHGGKPIELKFRKYELVTTHTARRSGATNMFKAGIPSISIMKITGHTTEKSFLKYIKISDEENAEMIKNNPFFSTKTNLY